MATTIPSSSYSSSSPHVMLFPFMSKGHIIPLLDIAKLIHRHRPLATFTIFTTTGNRPFISDSLSTLPSQLLTIISFPFPSADPTIPPGVESTDKLPSMSLQFNFHNAIAHLQPCFENALENLQLHDDQTASTCFLISDGFLYWTQESASKFNIPRLVFYGMSSYALSISRALAENRSLLGPEGKDELIQVPDFPWIRVTKNDFEPGFSSTDPENPQIDFVIKGGIATSKSYAMLVNSFYEIESKFFDHHNAKYEPKSWLVGPFCLAEKPISKEHEKTYWIEWLDKKKIEGKPVLYTAFGSQAEISNEQLKEILIGLENSGVDFIWALRIKPEQEQIMEGFEENVKERGLVVKGWLNQRDVLEHEIVQGFLSHCGWNSVTESVCAGVPILAWPMMAEQHLNARMVDEEIKVGLRVETCDGSVRGFVNWEGLSKMVKELMGGERGKAARKRVKELGECAKKAVEEGGTSWCNLEDLLNELESRRNINHKNDKTNNENGSSSIGLTSDRDVKEITV